MGALYLLSPLKTLQLEAGLIFPALVNMPIKIVINAFRMLNLIAFKTAFVG